MSILPEKKTTLYPYCEDCPRRMDCKDCLANSNYNHGVADSSKALDLAKQQLGSVERLVGIIKENWLINGVTIDINKLAQSLAQYNLKVLEGGKV